MRRTDSELSGWVKKPAWNDVLLISYLHRRYFLVKDRNKYIDLYPILVVVPLRSALGPAIYLLYTSEIPIIRLTTVATYADVIAIFASHVNPTMATSNLNGHKTVKYLGMHLGRRLN